MKAKTGFNLRTVCGENIIVAEGKENIDFSNIISMNESSAYLWKQVQDMESFTNEDLAQLLTEEYEVDYDTALIDANQLSAQWLQAGIISE
ncbi:MAG: PqqD family protein [Prevotella sp.]|nr:PqqD family protein [Prevotella sp.]